MKSPKNTAKLPPEILLMDALMHGPSGAIERQESQGQADFVESDTLPTRMPTEAKESLEAAGFKFLGPVDGDELFQYATFPKGWTKAGTDHSMWSSLLDQNGRKRGSIFYKAAFYDRDAHLSLIRRYSCQLDYDLAGKDGVYVCKVLDGETVIHETEAIPFDAGNRWRASDKSRALAEGWLNTNYPNWQSFNAYWGDKPALPSPSSEETETTVEADRKE